MITKLFKNYVLTNKFMPKKVRIPTPLRKLTNNEELVEVNATTIGTGVCTLDRP